MQTSTLPRGDPCPSPGSKSGHNVALGAPCEISDFASSTPVWHSIAVQACTASSSLWGKFGGLHTCGATFPCIVPLPNIFLTHFFPRIRLKRKDFQEIPRLAWAQEAPGSNPGAPTTCFIIFDALFLIPRRWRATCAPRWASLLGSATLLPLGHNWSMSNAGQAKHTLIALNFFVRSQRLLEVIGKFHR